jgi:hypothetical protein
MRRKTDSSALALTVNDPEKRHIVSAKSRTTLPPVGFRVPDVEPSAAFGEGDLRPSPPRRLSRVLKL